jgi:signal transduction histidine kinase
MDIKMPNLDGIEATQLIYERCPTPVVVLTSYETPDLVEEAGMAGVGAYLVKPPNVREMERAIAIAMARFCDMMELRSYAGQLEQRVQERTAQLQAQYAGLEAILRSASDGIVVTDAEGEVIQANPVALAWLTQTLSPEDGSRLQAVVRDLARQAGAGTALEERPEAVLELTGLDLELKAAPISKPVPGEAPRPDFDMTLANSLKPFSRAAQDEPAAVVDIHDVSHLKALDRMKSRFITNISHELRTPITTIKLYVTLMQQASPEKWRKYLDILAWEAEHQARLIEGILQISQIDTGRLEMKPLPMPLNQLLEVVIANRRALAQERGLALEYRPFPNGENKVAAGLVTLVDPKHMRQALDNLVKNAIQYTPEGGGVAISTSKEEAEDRKWATVTVADTGMGIPEEELPHVFERFFRGQKPRVMQISGIGLGLAVVKEIVTLHGGQVTVESEENEGSTFTIWLPLIENQA